MQILSEMIESNFATKQDLKDVRQEIKDLGAELRQEMSFMKHELKTDITDVRTEMRMLEHRITIKLGTIVSIAIGVAVTLTKLVA